ncbi:glutamine synthetase family protein [Aestuariispira insulae]|uniref:Glutamine synthetase n=1 Tax=Aestuariispira insulae TaxID=1461337 RepID=A0A3D9HXR1_9PROT|nr:glutamine synthetase family protein [Aestuariispira insulae]RED54293.1 glutamine synthetase [Aestuariispira insulae]
MSSGLSDQEINEFLKDHGAELGHLDAVVVDLNGIVRGKRYPMDQAAKLLSEGMNYPTAAFTLDVTGDCADPLGNGFSDGDPDGVALPVPGTLGVLDGAHGRSGMVLMTSFHRDGRVNRLEPRQVAAGALEKFTEKTGMTPMVAFELEFFLFDEERDAEGMPHLPDIPGGAGRKWLPQVYDIMELDRYQPFFSDLYRSCEGMGIPATVTICEFAPGQFEVNLAHHADALVAADQCSLFRHLVKMVARKHGLQASFLSKPFIDQIGSGMHLHISLPDGQGRNLFDPSAFPETAKASLAHAAGGLLDTMADGMGIFAPNLNAFRRFQPNATAPVGRSWGHNNRSVAVRVPLCEDSSMRLEHRVAGADANPYMVLAAVLAGIDYGLAHQCDPGVPVTGNAGEATDTGLPLNWRDALEILGQSTVMKEYLGADYLPVYCAIKEAEREKFMATISRQEIDWYL